MPPFPDSLKEVGIKHFNLPQLGYPDDIIHPADENSCSAVIKSGLNINHLANHLKSLSWKMLGATIDQSSKTGINQLSSHIFNKGKTTIVYEGIDQNNELVADTFTVTVIDKQAPRFIYSPGDIIVSTIPGECNTKVIWSEPVVADNCVSSDRLVVESNYRPGDTFLVGKTEVVYKVTDGLNEAEHRFNVMVVDNEQPYLIAPNPEIIVCGEEVEDAFTSWEQFEKAGGSVSDNCEIDYNSFRYVSQKSSGIRCPYTITRTYSIADVNGNIAEVSRVIEVTGEELQVGQENAGRSEPVLKSGTGTSEVNITEGGITNVTCHGESNGAIIVNVSSTSPPYAVDWSGPVSGNVSNQTGSSYTISNLSAGNYTIEVRDQDNNTKNLNVTITEPANLSASGTQTQAVSCFGGSNGIANVTPSGGTSPYAITPSQTGLSAGLYTFTVTDANGCTTTADVTITEPANLSASVTQTQAVSCFGGSNGIANVTPSGGTSPYAITPSQTGLSVGLYTFTVTDANGCTTTADVTITEPTNLSASVTQTQAVSCFGGSNGIANVTPSGGTSPYTISPSQTGLSAGLHTFTVTDANGCTTTADVTITEPAILSASIVATSPILCYNGIATIQISASGGTSPYTYNFEGESSNSTGIFTGISGSVAGTDYDYSVTDANGCTTNVQSITITQPPELTASANAPDVTCNGQTTTVTITATGGTSPLSYTLNGVTKNNGTFSGITAGNYTWSVTDDNNCNVVPGSVSIDESDPVTISSANITSPITCNGGTATVEIQATGGSGNYSYTFNGQTNATGVFSGVYAGTNLSISVVDDNGCGPAFESIDVAEPPALTANAAVSSEIRCNGETAEVTITASGGTGLLLYTFNGVPQTSNVFTGIVAGNNYVWSITDANGCGPVTGTLTVAQPNALTASVSETAAIICNGGTADILITASGGTGTKTYSFEGQPDDMTGEFTGILAGTYDWRVEDDNGCSFSGTYEIQGPAAVEITSIGSNSDICEGETLTLTSTSQGGTGNLSYSWSGPNGFTSNSPNPSIPNATSAASGEYELTVTDANNCMATATTDVTVHATPTMNIPTDIEDCHGTVISAITLTGAADSYEWEIDDTSVGFAASSGTDVIPAFTMENEGNTPITATITVTPSITEGCEGLPKSFTITVNPIPKLTITNNTQTLCENGTTNIVLSSNVTNSTFSWSGNNGTSGSGTGTQLIIAQNISSSVTYTINLSANGCPADQATETVTVFDENFNLLSNVTNVTSESNLCSGSSFFIEFQGASPSYNAGGSTFIGTNWQWYTRFEWSINNTNVTLQNLQEDLILIEPYSGTSDGDEGRIAFDIINNTDEDQVVTITITPWAYYRSRFCFFGCGNNWSSWEKQCAGAAYSKTITIRPFSIECPSDYVLNTDPGDCNATLTPDPLILNCDPGTTTSWSTSDGGYGSENIANYDFPIGTTTVTYRVEETPSNFRECTFDVTVTDDEAPVISNCPGDFNVPMDADECGAVITWTEPTVDDNCDVAPTLTRTDGTGYNSGDLFPAGTTTISYLANDATGNTSNCSFDITVAPDDEPPVWTCIGDQAECAPAGSPYIMIGDAWEPEVTENCSGSLTKTYSLSGATTGTGTSLNNVEFGVGTTTVTWTATDVNGNSSTCQFDVEINEMPAVSITEGNQSVCSTTGSATFTAAATGTPAATWQWYKDGTEIPGETGDQLTLNNVQEIDAGSYTVEVTNNCGTAISAPATLSVTSAPVITTQPASQTDCDGNLVEFDVVVQQGSTPYSYFWEMRETAASAWIEAATVNNIEFNADSSQLRVYNIGNPDNPDQSQYRVTVTDACGNTDISTITTLTANNVESADIAVQTVCEGEGTTITAITSGATPLSHQWLFDDGSGWIDLTNGGAYSGVTSATLTINNATVSETGEYRFRAVFPINKPNNMSATDCERTLITTKAVAFTVDPGPQIVAVTSTPEICAGDYFEIKIYDANGASGVTYSWTRTNESVLPGTLSEMTIGDTLIISGTLNSGSPGTLLTTTFNITGATALGCESTQQVSIDVGDEIAPTLSSGTCPPDTTVGADAGTCGAVVSYTPPTFDDNCDGADLPGTLVAGLASGETFPQGTTTVTYEYYDAAGNGPATCSSTVTVTDNQVPTASCQNFSVELDENGLATISVNDIDNGSSDNCGIDSMWLDITSFDCTNLGNNMVTLTVRDSSGFTDQCPAVVTVLDNTNPLDIVVNDISQTSIDCYGGTATVTILASGGVGPLTYTFGTASNQTGVFNNVSAGTYSWSITDPQHCGDTISASDFVVTQPGELNANIALTEVTCSSGDDGKITVIGSYGGSGDYEYRLESSIENRPWQSDSVFANLSPGFYDIWMRDSNSSSCEIEIQSDVEVYILTATITETDITCYNGNDGSISITNPAGGASPYHYSIDAIDFTNTTGLFTGLSADTFKVQIRDADNCIVVLDSMVILTQPDSLDATVASTSVSCGGADDGTITISAASGGTGSYEYSIDGGSTWQSSGNFGPIAAGFYDVWIRDGSLCTKQLEIVEITELPPLAADLDSVNISCYGGNDGTITVSNETGGSGVYEYSIDNGVSWQASGSYINLIAGTYQVILRDSNAVACELTLDANLVLTEPVPLEITTEPVDFADCEASTAQFSVGHSSGVGAVNFTWQKESSGTWTDLANAEDITGVDLATLQIANIEPADAGLYRLIIEDNCLADTSEAVTLTVNAILDLIPNVTTVEICGGTDTSFTVNTIGNNPVYQWQKFNGTDWDNVVDNSVISGSQSNRLLLSGATVAESGEYQVVVTFGNTSGTGCTIESNTLFERRLDVLPTPTLDSIHDYTYCEGDYPAPITLSGSPANVSYDLVASNYIGLFDQTNITTGEIAFPSFVTWGMATVTVTPKANGCVGTPRTFTINVEPKPIFSVAPPVQTICSGDEASIVFTGNTDSISYSWTVDDPSGTVSGWSAVSDSLAGGISQTLINLGTTASTVTYTVTSSKNGCPGLANTVGITVQPAIELVITQPDTVCEPGSVDITDPAIVVGSTPGLTYEYYLDSTLFSYHPDPANATTGTYVIKATDPATNCYAIAPVNVKVVPSPTVVINDPDPICAPGTIDLTDPLITAGSSSGLDYTYWEDDLATIPYDDSLTATDGIYFIKGETVNGCYDINPVAINVYTTLGTPIFADGAISDVCQDADSYIYSATAENSLTLTYSIDAASEAAGNTVDSNTGEVTFAPGYNGTIYLSATGTGCAPDATTVHTITVNEPPTLTLSAINPDPAEICRGEAVTITTRSVGNSVNQTYSGSSGNINLNIPDNSSTAYSYSSINLSGSGAQVVSASDIIIVTLNITHTYDADLDIFLVDPSGNYAMEISTNNGGSGNNYQDTEIRTDVANIIGSGGNNTAPFLGSYAPEGSITTAPNRSGAAPNESGNYNLVIPNNSLEGALIAGDWELRVFDAYNQDVGTLDNWSLSIVKQVGSGFITSFEGPGTIGSVAYSGTLNEYATVTVSPDANGASVYTATTTDANGCIATLDIPVIVNETPDPHIAADYCSIDGKIELTALGGASGATYSWSTGESTPAIIVDEVNIYSVIITNPNGCSATGYLDVSNELVVNGDFEAGNTGFSTGYGFVDPYLNSPPSDAPSSGTPGSSLWPEDLYGIGTNARYYHTNFWGRQDHTDGNGNFMIVNGNRTAGTPIWEETVIVEPNTNYYFSAWSMSLNSAGNDAVLQFEVDGELVGTQARLSPGVSNNSNNGWTRFYSDPLWNSGSVSGPITIRIRNVEPAAGGNDFGLDDISFGTLDPLPLEIDVYANEVCEDDTLFLSSNSIHGLEPITYSWIGPNGWTSSEQNPIIPNVSLADAGQYKLEATDGYGCEILPDSVTVIVETAPTVDAGPDTLVCSADSVINLNGIIGGSASSAIWTGGTGIFHPGVNSPVATYTLSPAEINAGVAMLVLSTDDPPGICEPATDTLFISIHESPQIDSIVTTEPLCNNVLNGTANVHIAGGTEPYSYLWSTGHTTPSVSGLGADTFWVQVSDANLCTVSDTFIITEPEPFVISPTSPIVVSPSCFGAEDGWAFVEVSGGIPPYRFNWDNNADPMGVYQDTAFNLPAGIYNVYVTDSANCAAANIQVTVPQPPPPILNCPPDYEDIIDPDSCSITYDTIVDPYYNGFCDVTLTYTVSGTTNATGTGSVNGQVAFNIGQSTVEYRIEDAAGNIDSCSFNVWVKHLDLPTANISCPADSVTQNIDPGSCEATVTNLNAPVIADPCNEIDSVWHNSPYGTSAGDASGSYPAGVTEFRWFITDLSGNIDSSCTVVITVNDVEPPVFITCPSDVEDVIADDSCSITNLPLTDPTYSDNCTPVLTYTLSGATMGSGSGSASGETFNIGQTTVTYVITDSNNNTDVCEFVVWVKHLNVPVDNYTCPQDSVWATPDIGNCEADVTLDALTYTDPCNEIDSVWNESPHRSSPKMQVVPIRSAPQLLIGT
ncbi:HYR domain-containing protein [Draconibacterium halophilum]|uniref:HYR domain-containing protein n=1 Tax=Draconibacterium halophilum TaxID=2706887 RepID=A0A6C0R8B1_9BACT|nr:HYR domain-containing protein [Draconibacterium halophilum]QIA06267.1 HYR domain-containing protein [Draconibacterium halophilum]